MALAHKRKPIRTLGMLIILILAIALVYFFIIYVSNYNINRISKINNKHFISEISLIPSADSEAYIRDLKALGTEKYTEPIIEYVSLYQESKRIDRAVNYAIIESKCITRTTVAKIDTQIQNKDLLLEKLKTGYNTKLDKIYWNTYIDVLENRYQIEELKTKVLEIPFC